jgi:flavin-binding protein dodecin
MPWYLGLVRFRKVKGRRLTLAPLVRPDYGKVWQNDRPGHQQGLDRPRRGHGHGQDEADEPDPHLDDVADLASPDIGAQRRLRVGYSVNDRAAATVEAPDLHVSTIRREAAMSDRTYRVTEIVGTSGESVDQAIRNGIRRAAQTLRHLDWFEVTEVRGHIEDGEIGHFQVGMKVGFRLEDA